MLSVINEIIWQKKLQTFGTNIFCTKKEKKNNYNKTENQTYKMCYHWSLLKVSIVVKLFNCCNAMGNKLINKAEFAGYTFQQIHFF